MNLPRPSYTVTDKGHRELKSAKKIYFSHRTGQLCLRLCLIDFETVMTMFLLSLSSLSIFPHTPAQCYYPCPRLTGQPLQRLPVRWQGGEGSSLCWCLSVTLLPHWAEWSSGHTQGHRHIQGHRPIIKWRRTLRRQREHLEQGHSHQGIPR